MKQFLITLLAVLTGVVLLSIVPFLITIGLIASTSESAPSVQPNSVLVYDLTTIVSDISVEDFNFSALMNERLDKTISLKSLLNNIEKASYDANIKGIVLTGNSVSSNLADMTELRKALLKFKESGKFVYYFSDVISQGCLYISSVADGVYMVPEGTVEMFGVSSQNLFLKNLLDNIGVDMQVIRHGKFKSAIEPYVQTSMSEPARLQLQKVVDGMWSQMRSDIAIGRGISEEALDEYVNNTPYANATTAYQAGLVDSLVYLDEFDNILRQKLGIGNNAKIQTIGITSYSDVYVEYGQTSYSQDKVAVVYAMGEILDGSNKSDQQNIYAGDLSRQIRQVAKDKAVKAIVLRVSSPGGSALASDIIWREIEQAKLQKPIVVSMGEYAASGGYYISCAANYIIAQPTTITGSIGVFGLIPCAKKLTDGIGLSFDEVRSNQCSNISPFSPLTDKQTQFLTKLIENTYDTFTKRCADGRGMTQESIDSIGQGRVWLGSDALNIGLVDELGGLEDAIDKAVELAGLGDYEILEYPKSIDMMESFLKKIENADESLMAEMFLDDEYSRYQRVKRQIASPSVNALLEYDIIVK